ncbi:MAG: carbohydrate ABC transporter permease [Clostridia bacterium]|nr:carbohydrate ABC transporter permease [Clostridia bacterium]
MHIDWERKKSGALLPVELKNIRGKLIYFTILVIVLIIALICLVPVLWLVITSMKDVKEIYQVPPTLLPKHIDLMKFKRVWDKMSFFKYYKNSFILCAGAILADIAISGLAGYVLSRLRPHGIRAVHTAIFLTMLIPGTVSLVPLFKTFLDMPIIHVSLVDTYIPMWLMACANCFNILIFKSTFDSVSKEFIEAAQIDGCSNFGIFLRIVMPLSLPVIMVIAILDFTGVWGEFLYPYLLLQNKDLYPVAVKIYDLKVSGGGILLDEYMMALFFTIIPPVILFIVFQKQMMNGVSFSGGVKG